jgi:hypothetical protein
VKTARRHLGPLWPYAILIGLPTAVFVLPDLFGGHLLMTGDNLQQNYPLHVLVGSIYRHGELPFWDQYLFSGTPLLAGFNAGAFYPLMGLFIVLPDRVAWIATEVVLFSLIAAGMYAFLRALRLSTAACLLAALTFTCSGVVLSQVNHLDMTEGFASIPFMLLAVLHIVRDGRWRWSVVLGIAYALVILGGAPEAMLDEAFLVIAYAALCAGLHRATWWRVLSRGAVGGALALSLSAVQWLPGIAAISSSQRSGLGATFTGTGSFSPANGFLSLVPYLFGGYGNLGEAKFFSHYNLPEVGIYLGILPVIALLTLWRPAWPSGLPGRERRTWYVIGLIGILLALGANTPLEHAFNALPLYGHQRLQSRNMIDVAVASCVLFAGWLDRRAEAAPDVVRFDRWVGVIPLGVVGALLLWAATAPYSLITSLTTASGSALEVHTVRVASLIALGFAAVAGGIVWLRAVAGPRLWLGCVAVFMAADLGLIAGSGPLIVTPSNALLAGTTQVENYVGAHLAPGGRFDFYDPQGYSSGLTTAETGRPDGNVLARLPAVGGYASIVSGSYDALTLTHTDGDLNVPRLASGALAQLDLQEILTAPEYFLVPLASAPRSLQEVRPRSVPKGGDAVLPLGSQPHFVDLGYSFYPAPRRGIGAGQRTAWFFGESLVPSGAAVLLTSGATPARIRFGLVGRTGGVSWGRAVSVARGERRVGAALSPRPGVGVAVQVLAGRLPSFQGAVTVGRASYELDGSLSSALQPGTWRQQGAVHHYTLFVRNRPPRPIYVETRGRRQSVPIAVVARSDNTESIRLHSPTPVVLVRDVAWDGGWRASISSDGGAGVAVPVDRHGAVQQVRVPAGREVVTFSYQPRHWLVASALSEGAALLLVLLLADIVLRRSGRIRPLRRRRAGVPADGAQQNG